MPPSCLAKPNFAEAVERLDAWWSGSSLGRPAVTCSVLVEDPPPAPLDPRTEAQRDMDPRWHLACARRQLDAHAFPAETMPGLFPHFASNLGIPSVLAGGVLDYRETTAWTEPMPDVYERDLPDFDPAHPALAVLAESLRLMGEQLGDRGLLSVPPLLDGLTTLSLFRDSGPLCEDLIDRPADVKRVAAHLDRLALDAHRALYEIINGFGHAQSVTWAGIYAPGKAEMVQCDFGIMLSPAMFEEFALPGLRLATDYMDRSCYHLDGTPQTRFLDLLCSLDRLHAIQWNPEPPAAPPTAWVDFFHAVRDRGKSLWVACDTRTAIALTRELGPDGLMLDVRDVKTVRDAEELLTQLK
ncbi:MAG TPA: hypothetical protein VMZ50_09770 [Phycisphaerae bacterium]|nr:hypothetical protein [Phycisphaerae bacterium]